ncbi:hypothetical protein BH09BAC3_BH09BAC3_21330 [soil metagenome]
MAQKVVVSLAAHEAAVMFGGMGRHAVNDHHNREASPVAVITSAFQT